MRVLVPAALGIALLVAASPRMTAVARQAQSTPPAATDTATGTLCVRSVPDPTPGGKSLFNDTGGNPAPAYSVQFDNGAIIAIPHSPGGRGRGVLVVDLPIDGAAMVRIRHQGTPIESFRFRFDADDHGRSCLFMDAFYLTWRMWPVTHLPGCACAGATRVSWRKPAA